MARGATANVERYKHNDMEDLERVLQKIPLEALSLLPQMAYFPSPVQLSIFLKSSA
jgi:hypothetical protein